jgi:hypothetical protein
MNSKQAQRPSTHRFIQLAQWADWSAHEAMMYRIRAGKAADIGNRNAAIYFVNRAQRCDSILQRARAAIVKAEA